MRVKSSANPSTRRFRTSTPRYTSRIRYDITEIASPKFSANWTLQSVVGKVDEILGPLDQVFFTVKPQEGIQATSFREGDKFYIGGDKLLPLDRYVQIVLNAAHFC